MARVTGLAGPLNVIDWVYLPDGLLLLQGWLGVFRNPGVLPGVVWLPGTGAPEEGLREESKGVNI